jgi:hypothetical protein
MNYSSYGFIGFALLFGMLFCIFSAKNIEQQDFINNLEAKQLEVYKSIITFRFNLWLQGMILGVAIGVAVLYFLNSKFNIYGNALLFTAIVLFVNYIFYMLYPKPAWMLEFTNNQKQVKEWLDVYIFMRNRYHWGMLAGVAAFFLLSLAFFDYKLNKIVI